ncbi:chemotaxis protein CheW [Idiomarina xiamenensis]|uniref:Chemotaxis protein CheW n=1 Tax=Idiomarina xiamenensis 10-D-4 TaxID=740709 RepID=K2JC06_9GAMM|nr:chemotaxis protein CheW [Idiomarina xiamenensis]EKE80816.1 chemotaxis protein CheW [Idiomarina xiamenensis 10-D-4]
MSRRQHEQAMTDYLAALLDEQPSVEEQPEQLAVDDRQQQLEKLLQGVSLAQLQVATPDPQQVEVVADNLDIVVDSETTSAAEIATSAVNESTDVSVDEGKPEFIEEHQPQQQAEPMPTIATEAAPNTTEPVAAPDDVLAEYQENDFQALFFSVAGLTLAVPLKSLGGIHQLGKVSPLFGKPDWFMGIMTERDDQLHAVDTARWVMPEKYNEQLAEQLDYQYLIMLSDSRWGLACERLVTSEPLQPDAIQWRKSVDSRRPWLAGVVRERMCALLDVNALIKLLDQGLGVKHATKLDR